jgi:hypothetical protein
VHKNLFMCLVNGYYSKLSIVNDFFWVQGQDS